MKIKLYGWQSKNVRSLVRLLRKHRRVLAVAPTGSGKTVIAAALLRLKQYRKKRVLWVAHRIELLRQARDQLLAAGIPKSEIGILSGADKHNTEARILVASVDMFGHTPIPPGITFVVIDEAHRCEAPSYQAIIAATPKALLLGLTATPWRLDGKGLDETFAHMAVMATPMELIAAGRLVGPVCYGIPRGAKSPDLKRVKSGKGDYVNKDLERAMMRGVLMGNVVKHVRKLAKGKATIVFAVNHKHARALWQRFKRAGFSAEYLSADVLADAKEREAMLKRLETGKTQVVVNVDGLSEGFDCPVVKCIALCRPTKSLTRFLQQCGRASRKWKGQIPIILDHAGNCARHGLPDIDQDWDLSGEKPGKAGGQAPVKMCAHCGCECLMTISAKVCPECGRDQPLAERELQEQEAELQRLETRKAFEERLIQFAKRHGIPEREVKCAIAA